MIKLSIFLVTIASTLLLSFYAGRWSAFNSDTSTHVAVQKQSIAVLASAAICTAANTTSVSNPNQASEKQFQKNQSTANQRPSYQRDLDILRSLETLATSAPAAALEQASRFKGDLRSQAQTTLLALWARTNPFAAWNWLETYQPDNQAAFLALLKQIGIYQPQTALDLAETMAKANPTMKKDVYQAALKGMAQGGDYESAGFLIDYLDDQEGIKQALISQLAGDWAAYEPAAALHWLMTQPAQLTAPAKGRLGAVWAETDPANATQFALQSAPDIRAEMLEQSFSLWLAEDTANAAVWLDSQPTSPSLDPLIRQLLEHTANDPSYLNQALDLSAHISDSETRINSLLSLLSSLRQRDPAQATTKITQLAFLSESERQRLQRELALTNQFVD
jgi:hypothetical protein